MIGNTGAVIENVNYMLFVNNLWLTEQKSPILFNTMVLLNKKRYIATLKYYFGEEH